MDGGSYILLGTLGFFFLTFIFVVVMRFIGYRETLHLAEKGLVRPDRTANGGGKDTLRWGVVITAVGLALCVGLYPIGLLPGSSATVAPSVPRPSPRRTLSRDPNRLARSTSG